MIKRNYFMRGVKYWEDGTSSFSYQMLHYTITSWKENSTDAFKYGRDEIEKLMDEKPGTDVDITCFSRC